MTNGKADRYGGVDSGLGDDVEAEASSAAESQKQDNQYTHNPSPSELPHRVRYDSPKKARDRVNISLAQRDQEQLADLENVANREFDETVHRTDVRLAALRAGLQSTDSAFLDAMREIGYGYFD